MGGGGQSLRPSDADRLRSGSRSTSASPVRGRGDQGGMGEDTGAGRVEASSSNLYAPTAISRMNRPASLYIPMEEETDELVMVGARDQRGEGHQAGNTPTWPFTQVGPSPDHLFAPLPNSAHPVSPSMIHPSYADRPETPPWLPHPAPSDGSAPPITTRLFSAISFGDSTSSFPPQSNDKYSSSTSNSRVNYDQLPYTPDKTPPRESMRHATVSAPRSGAAGQAGASRFDTPAAWLVLYFTFNLGLTLFNKLVLQGFPFPWTLTGIQMLSGTIGTQIALNQGFFVQARLTPKETAIMVAFSVLYTVNIAVSNLSLHLVTVPVRLSLSPLSARTPPHDAVQFHQVVRAMTPLFTIVLSTLLLHKRHSRNTYLSLLPVVVGVVFATYGDYYFTPWGFILTLFGTILAALKTIVTNRIQVGRLKLHPLDLLIRMSPLAFMQCVACAWFSGELDRVRVYGATEMNQRKAIALVVNGLIAFGLNVVSFTANKKTSALTMTVAGEFPSSLPPPRPR